MSYRNRCAAKRYARQQQRAEKNRAAVEQILRAFERFFEVCAQYGIPV